MKFLPLIWAQLWRSKARTWLTFLSIAVAFLLFGLLQAVTSSFAAGVRLAGADRLIVAARAGFVKPVPYSYRAQIEAVPGVKVVDIGVFFGGSYQDPRNQVPSFVVDPKTVFDADPRLVIDPEQKKAFQNTRTGAIIGRDLAAKYHWKVGDKVPLTSFWTKTDGSQNWTFDVVGIFTLDEKLVGQDIAIMNMLIGYDYFDEARQFKGMLSWIPVRIDNPKNATAVGKAIDKLFQNSSTETKTQTEADFTNGFVKQIGDVGLIISGILSAVFFTLLLVVVNTMMQAFRERVPELAVLKTLGFTDRQVGGLVIAESVLLCLVAAALGMVLAELIVPGIRRAMAQFLAAMTIERGTLIGAAVIATGVGALSAAVPAWRSARLSVIEGLSGH
jgi:putative ABC transport system permease protein